MFYRYTPEGVCSREIMVELDDDKKILNIAFVGGCNGNTQGVAALCIGRSADEIIGKLEGIRCGQRRTSCPDQLARALKAINEDIETGEVAMVVE